MKKILLIGFCISIVSTFNACKKSEELLPQNVNSTEIINQFSQNISQQVYAELAIKSNDLKSAILNLSINPTANKLDSCKLLWKETRSVWEKSEAFLFGPVATNNIDPRIDTWPVNFTSLDSIIAGNQIINSAYLTNLEDALKGFHPIEYFLFGLNSNKRYDELTSRELDYLVAASTNLAELTNELALSWSVNNLESFHFNFINAGESNSTYINKKEALLELVNAMAGICDEVANGKIFEPFNAQNSLLEESPFSKNSIVDFTNNIKGVQMVYLGNYNVNGIGLEDFVRLNNLSLDNEIKLKISNAISALNIISLPFGEAIISQPVQVQNAINAINELKDVVDNELLTYVQLNTKD